MKSIGPFRNQQPLSLPDSKLSVDESKQRLMNTASSLIDPTKGDLLLNDVEAKMLNNYIESRRYSYPGSMPRTQEVTSMDNSSGSSRNRQASLDSMTSRHTSRSSIGSGILRQSQDSRFKHNLSLYSTGPSEYLTSSMPVQSNSNAETRSRYSPMFVQYDSLSSPFSSTTFEKSPGSPQITPMGSKDVSDSKSTSRQEGSRGLLIAPPPTTRPELHSNRSKHTSGSVLRSDALEYIPKFLAPGVKEHEERQSGGLENLDPSSLPVPISDPSRVLAKTSVPQTRTDVPTTTSQGIGPLPNISALSITDDSQIHTVPPVSRREGSRRYSDFVPKSTLMLEKDEDDSDIDSQSDTDSDGVGPHELELPAIDVSSEFGSEEESAQPPLSQAKRAGSQKNNSFNVSVLELYKTEICLNWLRTRNCSYGNKCHYAHGVADLRTRQRIETYKTQPCADPARSGCHVCMYTSRCNYAHPGEPIRRMGPHPRKKYYDPEYFEALRRDYPHHEMPFGVFV